MDRAIVSALLVSVRDGDEALAAFSAGAAVIDVKEPARGPLGRADEETWREVRSALPDQAIVSVALGEWNDADWSVDPSAFLGINYRKVGPAGLGTTLDPFTAFARFRARFNDPTPWVFVIYADWTAAEAPHPDLIVDAALAIDRSHCAGVLIDTWDKRGETPFDRDLAVWSARVRRIQAGGRFAALAGQLDEAAIKRFRTTIAPDLFAVRGAACEAGNRRFRIDPARVARLVDAAGGPAQRSRSLFSNSTAPAYDGR